ncbi:uncharacterized protein LOC108682926 [Hyalella azteca]|uniref:Uncharacterized protein LOC108682926 n=1 Tax=Hyalella azteca TaxID=294128 RepID=A0A8B7PQZ2_HYAAZ|nr:uncharacterized protein LOC108682926 [Hyalella azteca]
MRLRTLFFATCMVMAVDSMPQFELTKREMQAFEAVLGNSRPLSISSAVPVFAFSDNTPSKFVELPEGKLNGLALDRSGEPPIPASKIHFEESFARGATDGPVFDSRSGLPKHQGVVDIGNLASKQPRSFSQLGDESFVLSSSHNLDSFQGGSSLTSPKLDFGFKPLQETTSKIHQGSEFTASQVVKSTFSPSPQIDLTGGGTFRPSNSVKQFGDPGVLTDDNLAFTNFGVSGFGTSVGDVDLTSGFGSTVLSNVRGGSKEPFDVKAVSVTGKHLREDDNLYRHHVGASLVPTHGGGPGTTVVGKIHASKGHNVVNTVGIAIGGVLDGEGDLVTRSLDSQENNFSKNTVNTGNIQKQVSNTLSTSQSDSHAVVGTSISFGDPKARIRGTVESVPISIRDIAGQKHGSSLLGGVSQDRFRAHESQRQSLSLEPQQFTNVSPENSKNVNFDNIFKSSSVQFPNIPDIQLPLQAAGSSAGKNSNPGIPEGRAASPFGLETASKINDEKPALLSVHNFRPPSQNQVKTPGRVSPSSNHENPHSPSQEGTKRSEQILKLLRERAAAQNSDSSSQQLSEKPSRNSFSIPGSVSSQNRQVGQDNKQQNSPSAISLQNKQIADTLAKIRNQPGGQQSVILAKSPAQAAASQFSVSQIHELLKSSQLSTLAGSKQQSSGSVNPNSSRTSGSQSSSQLLAISAGNKPQQPSLSSNQQLSTSLGPRPQQSAVSLGQQLSSSALKQFSVSSQSSSLATGQQSSILSGLKNPQKTVGSSGTTIVHATSGQTKSSLPPSALKSLAGLGNLGGLGALAGASAAGGQPQIIVKSMSET